MLTDGEGTDEAGAGTATDESAGAGAPNVDANARLLEVYESGMSEARGRADRLERELAEERRKNAAPKVAEPAAPKMDNNEFWANAAENVAKIVESALDKRIKPLTDFVNETRGATEYDRIKEELKGTLKDKYADVEPYLDEVMKTTNMTRENVNAAALSIVGALAVGQLKPIVKTAGGSRGAGDPPPTPPNPSTTKNDASMMPAHLRPSGPSVNSPTNQQKKERRPLTELEKRIARESRMTDDEYLDELEDSGPMQIHDIMPKSKEEKEKGKKK